MADVLLPILATWGRPVRKSRIQLQREVFSLKILRCLVSRSFPIFVQVGKGSVECNRVICGSVGAVCKLSGSRVAGIMVFM